MLPQAKSALSLCFRRYAHTAAAAAPRTPLIKFTHGARSIINSEMAELAHTSIHPSIVVSAVKPGAASSPAFPAVTHVTVGGYTTRVVRVSESEYIPPSVRFDATAMAMIELGGAMPDPPKTDKDGKKKGKK